MISSGGQVYRTPISSPGYADSDLLLGPAFSVLSAPAGVQDDPQAAVVATPSASVLPQGNPTFWLVGLVGLAIVMHVIHRKARQRAGKVVGGIDEAVGINIWNLLNVTVLASVGILTAKVGINKWAAGSGAAQVVNAI